MEKFFEAAEVINSCYDVASSYNRRENYRYVFILGDDITTVLKSMATCRDIACRNPDVKFVMVSGDGLSDGVFKVMRFAAKVRGLNDIYQRLQPESGAQHLKRVALALEMPEKYIMTVDGGRNTTENLRLMSMIADGKKSLVISTQRLAMIFKQSADYQCNRYPERFYCRHFDYDMYVIHQNVMQTMRWYNLQAAGGGRVALHLYASLVRRFEVYDGKFWEKPFEPDKKLHQADSLLRPKFMIKQKRHGLGWIKALFQYVPIIWDVFWNPERYLEDESEAIASAVHFPYVEED